MACCGGGGADDEGKQASSAAQRLAAAAPPPRLQITGSHARGAGVVEGRRCRDVLFLLLFVAYWAGMYVVCGIAFAAGARRRRQWGAARRAQRARAPRGAPPRGRAAGDPNRLVYAVDSSGLLCGSVNTVGNTTIDLTDRPNLYYLNALDLLTPSNLPYAKSVCVSACPTAEELCDVGALPCTRNEQYRCPYYRLVEGGLWGKLAAVNDTAAVAYWDQLPTATLDSCDGSFLAVSARAWLRETRPRGPGPPSMAPRGGRAPRAARPPVRRAAQAAQGAAGLNLSAFGVAVDACDAAPGAGVGGRYLQASSQFPGKGPCYPVWAATVPYFNRCFPKFPANFTGSVASLLDATSGVGAGAASLLRERWGAAGPRFGTYVADISKGVLIVVAGGLGCGVAMSLAWMLVLRFFSGLMVWATIAVVSAALLGCTLFAYNTAGLLATKGAWGAAIAAQLPADADPTGALPCAARAARAGRRRTCHGSRGAPAPHDQPPPAPPGLSRDHWAYVAYGLTGLTALVALFTLVMLRRVKVAVASQAVATMPSILLFPLLPFMLEVGLVIYWVAVTAVLYSAGLPADHWRPAGAADAAAPLGLAQLMLGNATAPPPPAAAAPNMTGWTRDERLAACSASPDCYVSFDWDARLRYAFAFHLFGLLWTNQFIIGFASVVVAGAVAGFYWARGDARAQARFPVLRAMRVAACFHLGSVALGSLVIAVIQFVRLLLEYVDKKSRALQAQNKIAGWLMCLVRGLLWLLEKVVAFINRNAFILVAAKGSGYCASAGRAVTLVVSNALRLAAVTIVGDALLFLGKLGVAASCGVAAFGLSRAPYYTDAAAYPATYLSSGLLPIALAALTGYAVAAIFFSVYELAIDTVLLSFCEDCEANGGHPRCAPPLLLDAIGEARPPPHGQQQQGGKPGARRSG
ncbi:CHER1 [Scenedesmus sp. PABB004]|nr:CHER1 [Scenedesmus sp. PABB004]